MKYNSVLPSQLQFKQEGSMRYKAVGEIPRFAVIRDRDRTSCESLADQIRVLGIPEKIVCDDACINTFADIVLPDAPDASILLTCLRDAVLCPAEVDDLRHQLPSGRQLHRTGRVEGCDRTSAVKHRTVA